MASPHSPIDVSTFTEPELRAAVEAAENWGGEPDRAPSEGTSRVASSVDSRRGPPAAPARGGGGSSVPVPVRLSAWTSKKTPGGEPPARSGDMGPRPVSSKEMP